MILVLKGLKGENYRNIFFLQNSILEWKKCVLKYISISVCTGKEVFININENKLRNISFNL